MLVADAKGDCVVCDSEGAVLGVHGVQPWTVISGVVQMEAVDQGNPVEVSDASRRVSILLSSWGRAKHDRLEEL